MTARTRIRKVERNTALIVIPWVVSFVGIAQAQRAPSTITLFPRIVERGATCETFVFKAGEKVPDSDIFGCIRGVDQMAGPIQVQLRGVDARQNAEVAATKLGEFRLENVSAGTYLLLTTQGKKVLGITSIPQRLGTPPMLIDVTRAEPDEWYVELMTPKH